jgi:hypothetical protein
MKLIALLALTGCIAVAAAATAQPLPAEPSARAPLPHLEGFPPDAQPVLGAPGAYSHPDIPPGFVLIDGDIQVPLADYMVYLGGGDAVFGDVSYWPNIIPYDFVTSGGGAVTPANQQLAIAAMNQISDRTSVIFRPVVSGDLYRIRFQNSTGNNAPVGFSTGVSTVNIASWNTQFVLIHELHHILGFWHQQSASNRNSYVTINFANISTTACNGDCSHNFDIRGGASVYGDYDFDSFMHYPRTAFSSNGQDTITVNPPWNAQWQNAIGQRNHFSYWDELVSRGIYRYSSDYWWQAGAGGSGNLPSPLGGTLPSRMNTLPQGSTLFIKQNGNYSAVGTYSNPMTIRAPLGATLGD